MTTSTAVVNESEMTGKGSSLPDVVGIGAPSFSSDPRNARPGRSLTAGALPVALGFTAMLFHSAAPWLSGAALLLLVTVGVGLAPTRLLRIVSTGSRLRSDAAALLLSFPVGIAISSLVAQPLLWTGTFSTIHFAAALNIVGFVISQFGTPPPQRPSPPPSTQTDWVCGAAIAAATAIAFQAASTVGPNDPDGLGLLRVLPITFWLAISIVAVVTWVLLPSGRSASWWMIPTGWLLVLHAALHSAHAHPRFPTAWLHAGFADYLVRNGGGGTSFDARFAWPGLFATFAGPLDLLPDVAAETLIRWWPVLVIACLTFLVWRIAELAFPRLDHLPPIAATVFVLLSWTGQDYFSPQSVGIMLHLLVVVLVEESGTSTPKRLQWWPFRVSAVSERSQPNRRLRKRARRELAEAGGRPMTRAVLALTFALGMVVIHPLSPIFLVMTLVVLALFGRRLAPLLLAAVIAFFTTWFVLTAAPWWSTQIDGMVAQISDPFGNLNSNASERVAQASEDRLVVAATRTRVALGAFLVIGVFGLLSMFRPKLRSTMPLAPLAVSSLLVIGLQSYGGEMAIRAFLFAVPFVAIMAARLLWSGVGNHSFRRLAITAVPLILTVPFLLARFGNETFEMTTTDDRAAVLELYEVIEESPESTTLVSGAFVVSWGDRFAGDVPFAIIDVIDPATFDRDAEASARLNGDTRVLALFAESDRRFRLETESLDPNWNREFVAALVDAGWTLRYEQGTRFIVEKQLP